MIDKEYTGHIFIGKCPVCGSENIMAMYDGSVDEKQEVEISFSCLDCTHIFSVVYKIGIVEGG